MHSNTAKKIKWNPVRILCIGFALVILTGGILLTLPVSSIDRTYTSFVDSLFTSTSAVCVTGLVTLDTGSHWSYFGKTVIMCLIQVGGLGFMSFATLFALVVGKKITLSERLVMQEAMNANNLQGLVKMAKYILIFTFSVEGVGAALLSTQFIPEFGPVKGIYYSIFHSVSAFCNAGFDILGTEENKFISLITYQNNPVIILTIGALIVTGGLGFAVWADIYNFKGIKRLSLHSKTVITVTLILIFGGALLMFLIEQDNPGTMGNQTIDGKLLSSVFASITPRTAGFNSISTSDMMPAGRFLTIILMFIGGSPGSTAGGIKTTTLAIIIFTIISAARGKEDTEIYKKRIPRVVVLKAFIIATLALLLVTTMVIMLTVTEKGASLEYIIYEVTSGFGTVGLTLGLTPRLTIIGKLLLVFTMYSGRVGPLTMALSIAKKDNANLVRYPEDKVLVG